MPSYVALMNWTDQGAQNSRDTLERAKSFDAMVEKSGGKVREHVYTLGGYDIVMVIDFPNDETAAGVMLELASLGNVRTQTMRAFTDEEMSQIASRAA